MIDTDKYKIDNFIPYMKKPYKPVISSCPEKEDIEIYLVKKEQYEKDYAIWNEYQKNRRKREAELNKNFKQDLIDEYCSYQDTLTYGETIEQIYKMAYEDGHSYGYYEITNLFARYIEILKYVKIDIEK